MTIEKKNVRPAGTKPTGKFRKGGPVRRKVCRFCTDKIEIDYKNVSLFCSQSRRRNLGTKLLFYF